MPLDPARIAETKAWFEKAASDLRAANHDLLASPPLTDDVVFHAQQSAEKAMKGYLSWHDQPFRKTHDLTEIGRQAKDALATAQEVVQAMLARLPETIRS